MLRVRNIRLRSVIHLFLVCLFAVVLTNTFADEPAGEAKSIMSPFFIRSALLGGISQKPVGIPAREPPSWHLGNGTEFQSTGRAEPALQQIFRRTLRESNHRIFLGIKRTETIIRNP